MIKWILERIIIELFIYYEKITKDIFLKIFSKDGGFSKSETKKYWIEFDTSSATHIKAFIRFLKDIYSIDWYNYKKDMRKKEKYTRRIRGDIIHAKKRYNIKKYILAIKIILKLIIRKKRYLYKPIKEKKMDINKQFLLNKLKLN